LKRYETSFIGFLNPGEEADHFGVNSGIPKTTGKLKATFHEM